MTEPLEVVAAIIADRGSYLSCRRRAGLRAGGFWEFPGGKVEPGESPAEAIKREILEELNCRVKVIRELWRDDTVQDDQVIRLICMETELEGERPSESTDHDALRWVTPSELATLGWARPDLPAVARLSRR